MPAAFLGLKLLGSDASKAVASWSIAPNTGDTVPAGGVPVQIPGQIAYYAATFGHCFKYLIDIQSVAGNYVFGVIKRLRLVLTHSRAWEDGATNFFIPGRVWIYIPSTGEVFVYGSRDSMTFGNAAVASIPEVIIETIQDVIDVQLPPNTQILVVVETDNDGGTPALSPDASMNLSLYNF